jgi:hypothetical protein
MASCESSIGNSGNDVDRVEGQWSGVSSADSDEDDRVTHFDDGYWLLNEGGMWSRRLKILSR